MPTIKTKIDKIKYKIEEVSSQQNQIYITQKIMGKQTKE